MKPFNPIEIPDPALIPKPMAKKDKPNSEQTEEQSAPVSQPTPEGVQDALLNQEAVLAEDNIEIDKIRSMLSSNDIEGGFVRLERRGPLDQNYQYVAKISVNKFDIDYIKRVYGGGDYRARTFRSNGQMWKPFDFSVDHRVKGQLDEDQIKQLSAPDKGGDSPVRAALEIADRLRPAPTVDNSTPLMLKLMEQQKHAADQSMTLMVTMMTESQKTTMAMMTGMMQAIAQMANKPPPPPPPSFDFAATFTPILLKMIESPQKSNMTDTIEMIRALKELSGPAGEEKEETMLDKLFKVLGPVGGALVQRAMGGPGPGAVVNTGFPPDPSQVQGQLPDAQLTQTQSNHQPSPAPAPGPVPGAGGPADNLAMVRFFIETLYSAAARRADVGLYCDMILDNLSDAQLLELYGVLTQNDWHAKLFQDVNRFAQHQVWFNELRAALVTAIAPQTPQPTAPVGSPPVQAAAASAPPTSAQ